LSAGGPGETKGEWPVPAQTKKKSNRKGKVNRWIALVLAAVMLGGILLAAALSSTFY